MEPRLRVLRVMRPLELLRRQVAQGGVQADAVVERLDVLEDARPRLGAGRVRLVVDQLPLQAGEEALDRRVVPALADAAHTAGDAVLAEEELVMLAGILAAPVGVRQQPRAGQPPAYRHAQGV